MAVCIDGSGLGCVELSGHCFWEYGRWRSPWWVGSHCFYAHWSPWGSASGQTNVAGNVKTPMDDLLWLWPLPLMTVVPEVNPRTMEPLSLVEDEGLVFFREREGEGACLYPLRMFGLPHFALWTALLSVTTEVNFAAKSFLNHCLSQLFDFPFFFPPDVSSDFHTSSSPLVFSKWQWVDFSASTLKWTSVSRNLQDTRGSFQKRSLCCFLCLQAAWRLFTDHWFWLFMVECCLTTPANFTLRYLRMGLT